MIVPPLLEAWIRQRFKHHAVRVNDCAVVLTGTGTLVRSGYDQPIPEPAPERATCDWFFQRLVLSLSPWNASLSVRLDVMGERRNLGHVDSWARKRTNHRAVSFSFASLLHVPRGGGVQIWTRNHSTENATVLATFVGWEVSNMNDAGPP